MKILNIKNLNPAGLNEILSFCLKMLSDGKGAFLIPMNPIKVMKARKHPDFQDIIDRADWVFPDAVGMKWAASLLYGEKISLTPGYRLMFSLLEQAEKYGHSVYFLGTTNEILEIADWKLREIHPKLKIAGCHNGFFSEDEETNIFREIANLKPDYVFVAMGEYKQEKIIWKLRQVYPKAIYLGVGGSIDLIAGKQPNPPEWIRKNHLEWIYRFFRQPSRAPRFKPLPIFLILLCLEKVRLKAKSRKPPA